MKINNKKFWPSLISIIVILVLVTVNLQSAQKTVDAAYSFLADRFSWLFILANLCAFIFALWIALGPYAKLRLGGEEAVPEYSTFSWIAMMFTTSCSAGLIVFGFIEPIYYISEPPFQLEPFSETAYEYAEMYSHYHWGLNAWSLYVPASIAIAYMIYNRKKADITMSSACEPILKKHTKGLLGDIIDILSTFGAVVAPVTSMGLGMPLLTMLLQEIFGISDQYTTLLQTAVLIIWILIFGMSVYLGLKKGIKRLSNGNVICAFGFMIFVGGLVGAFSLFKAEINTLGLYIHNFIRMAAYTDPYGSGQFVQKWTVWYWAWLIVYMPLMGIFNARISKGRTLREVALGQMIFCSLGCWIAMATLGNYSLSLQKNGVLDVAAVLHKDGQAGAILAILKTMPFPKIMMVILSILCFLFMATTVDSSSYVAAESTTRHDNEDEHAPKWCRILWASVSCIITLLLLEIGGFSAVQTLAILIGLPLAVIMFIVIVSAIKMIRSK